MVVDPRLLFGDEFVNEVINGPITDYEWKIIIKTVKGWPLEQIEDHFGPVPEKYIKMLKDQK